MDGEGSCVQTPLPSVKTGEGVRLRFLLRGGGVCTQAMGRAASIMFSLVNCNNVVNCNTCCKL